MPIFRIRYSGHHTCVSAHTLADAISYVLQTHGEPNENEEAALQFCRIKVIDLVEAETAAPAANPKPATPAADDDEITHQEAMAMLGMSSQGVSDAKYKGILVRGKAKGSVTRASIEVYLAKRAQWPERLRDSAARMRKAKAANRAKPQEEAKPQAEDMVRAEKLAKELNISEELVRRLQARHHIPGGYGWVERNAFMPAYKEYQQA